MATEHKRVRTMLERAIITSLLFDTNDVFTNLESEANHIVDDGNSEVSKITMEIPLINLDKIEEIKQTAYTLTEGHPGEVLDVVNSELVQSNLDLIGSFVLEILTTNYQILIDYNRDEENEDVESTNDFSMLDTVVLEGLYQSTIGTLIDGTVIEEENFTQP